MPRRGKNFYVETVLTKTVNDVVVECVIDCGEHSDDDFFAQMHKQFVQAIEKNLKAHRESQQKKKKKKKKSKRSEQKWEAEKILGSTIKDGQLMFMVKWKNNDDIGFISSQQAKQKYPELVQFYFAKRLQWEPIHDKQTYKMIERI